MFSADELNKVCNLEYDGDYKIVEFNQYHMEMLELNKHDKAWHKYYKNYAKQISDYYTDGTAFTGLAYGNVVCCFGFTFLWNGVYEAWLLPTPEKVKEYVIPFHRSSLKVFDYAMSKHSMNRLQIVVSSQNALARRWAERCYFKNEGLLHKYGPEGIDYYMFARS